MRYVNIVSWAIGTVDMQQKSNKMNYYRYQQNLRQTDHGIMVWYDFLVCMANYLPYMHNYSKKRIFIFIHEETAEI